MIQGDVGEPGESGLDARRDTGDEADALGDPRDLLGRPRRDLAGIERVVVCR